MTGYEIDIKADRQRLEEVEQEIAGSDKHVVMFTLEWLRVLLGGR